MVKKEIVKWIVVGICIAVTALYAFWYYQTVKQTVINAQTNAQIVAWICKVDPVTCGQAPANQAPTSETTK